MEALVRAARTEPGFPAEPVLVVADRPEAAGLGIAAGLGVPTALVESRGRPRRAFEAELDTVLRAHAVEVVALAGFLRVLTPGFVARWQGRLLNIHPSLLPRHPGLHTHARAIAAGDRETGATVHLVTAELDRGPILAQARVPVRPDDTPERLAARVLAEEHRLYPRALAAFLRGEAAVPPPPPGPPPG